MKIVKKILKGIGILCLLFVILCVVAVACAMLDPSPSSTSTTVEETTMEAKQTTEPVTEATTEAIVKETESIVEVETTEAVISTTEESSEEETEDDYVVTTIKLPEKETEVVDDLVTDILKEHNVTLQEIKDIWITYQFDGDIDSFEEFDYTDVELANDFDNYMAGGWWEYLSDSGWESFADWTTEEGLEEMRATLTNPDDPNTVLTEKQVNALNDNDLTAIYSLWYYHELYFVLGY